MPLPVLEKRFKYFIVNFVTSLPSSINAHREICINVMIVEGGSSSKQRLPCRGNIMAVVFPKRLELNVINCTHSALTFFGISLACGSSLKLQKPCQGFMETLLGFWCSLRLPFWASSGAISMVLAELLCFSLLSSCVHIFILEFFITARL